MTLSDRIQQALDAYYADDSDIDIMANLLVEAQAKINQSDESFQSIVKMCADIDKGLDKLSLYTRPQG